MKELQFPTGSPMDNALSFALGILSGATYAKIDGVRHRCVARNVVVSGPADAPATVTTFLFEEAPESAGDREMSMKLDFTYIHPNGADARPVTYFPGPRTTPVLDESAWQPIATAARDDGRDLGDGPFLWVRGPGVRVQEAHWADWADGWAGEDYDDEGGIGCIDPTQWQP